ncbi:oxygen-insensitive NAD(P)H nitroreductase [Pseudomonas oryzihabitans]|uniref:oxygen-insensitive NAD(P)H nitroreductase n=1 Tax=Pseudomonas oryzihabitans TaxID=47885 RepID=UPI002895BF4B|nr:oxygen-insensitive NAD(P)H nitroreductase [Pseudomonas oryzihabitans]MDT3719465.1 oxygen-insensitive NAD(P)H nitroreductase [Pseudomonas oryzihabitans]
MQLSQIARTRYTTKAFDGSRSIPAEQVEELLELLRQAPSSVNSQPWHFVVAASAEAKVRIARGMQSPYNEPKVLPASHVIVLCTRLEMTEGHLAQVLEREAQDGRFAKPEARAAQDGTRRHFVDLHRHERKDVQHWMEKQTYLALGTLLLGAAALGIDATPMEGFDANSLDKELGLREQGYTALVVVGLGYRGESDFNAALPKSRLAREQVFTFL